MSIRALPAVSAPSLLISAHSASAQVPERINYQGRLVYGTNLVNGSVQLVFRMYDAEFGGTGQYVETQTVAVVDGLYATAIGASNAVPGALAAACTNAELWLELDVDGATLSPRERIVSVLYAIKANSVPAGAITTEMLASNAVTGVQIADGSITGADLSSNTVTTATILDGSLTAADVAPNTFWETDGNAGTTAGTHFLGTTDNQPLEIRGNGIRLLRLEPTGLNTANISPLITRLYDPYSTGTHQGAGRWGLFMEPHMLVAGIPAIAAKTFRVSSYNVDSTINTHLMTVDQAGTVTATSFNPTSDRNAKENVVEIEPREVLGKVAALPISKWNFVQDPGADHVGPMAQDFRAAFGLGTDDKHIATVDADGVALAAIQGLHQLVKEKDAAHAAEIQALRREIDELKNTVLERYQPRP